MSAIGSDWLARMSGPLTVPFTVAAFFLPSTLAKISFAILAVIAALITCFRIWDRAESEKEKLREELAEATRRGEAKVARDWPAEWKDLARQFEAVNAHWVRADWQHTSGGEGWMICGGDPHANNNLETLCSFAGKLLAISPRASSILSSDISSCHHPMSRWLYLLKQRNKGYETGFVGLEVFEAKDGVPERKVACYAGSIRELAVVSASQCIELAAHEL